MPTMTTVPIRIADADKEQLDALAAATGRSRNHHLTEAVRRYIADESWQIAKIRQGLAEADADQYEDDAAIETEMRQMLADARAARVARTAGQDD